MFSLDYNEHWADTYAMIVLAASCLVAGAIIGCSILWMVVDKAFPNKVTKKEALKMHYPKRKK